MLNLSRFKQTKTVNPNIIGVKYLFIVLRWGTFSHATVFPYLLVKKIDILNLDFRYVS